MRKLYKEYFYVPKNGKINDKVILSRLIATVATLVLCLIAMSATAYAYFSYNVTSNSNTIKAARFDTDISITTKDNGTTKTIDIISGSDATYTAELKAGKVYNITIDNEDNEGAAETGFCIITAIDCNDTFHTQQIGKDSAVQGGFTDKVEFQLTVTADTVVSFEPHWGTSTYHPSFSTTDDRLYITNSDIDDNKVVMTINKISGINLDDDSNDESTNNSDDKNYSNKNTLKSTAPSKEPAATESNISSEATSTNNSSITSSKNESESSVVNTEPPSEDNNLSSSEVASSDTEQTPSQTEETPSSETPSTEETNSTPIEN